MNVARGDMSKSKYSAVYLRQMIKVNQEAKHVRIGRPIESWLQCVKADLGVHHYGLASVMHLARRTATRYKQTIIPRPIVLDLLSIVINGLLTYELLTPMLWI